MSFAASGSYKSMVIPRLDDSYDYLFKVIVIGDAGVGKTCIVQRFKSGTYIERHGNTIGVDFTLKTLDIEGKKIKLQIWDTAGQERFRTITQSYYRSAHGVIVTYDITKLETFHNIPRWLEDVKKYAGNNTLVLLVGTKQDIVAVSTSLRQVTCEEARRLADSKDLLDQLETSSKDDINVDKTFKKLARALMYAHQRDDVKGISGIENASGNGGSGSNSPGMQLSSNSTRTIKQKSNGGCSC